MQKFLYSFVLYVFFHWSQRTWCQLQNKRTFTAETIPNPFTNPTECNRPGLDHSWICDPNHVLTARGADELEQSLTKLRDTTQHQCPDGEHRFYQLAVVVLDAVDPSVDTPSLSLNLLNRWGIGTCDDGMLLLIDTGRQDSHLAWKDGVNQGAGNRPVITPYFVERLRSAIHHGMLRVPGRSFMQRMAVVMQLGADLLKSKGDFSVAILTAVEAIREQLPVWVATQKPSIWVWTSLGGLLLAYSAAVVGLYIWSRSAVKAHGLDRLDSVSSISDQHDDSPSEASTLIPLGGSQLRDSRFEEYSIPLDANGGTLEEAAGSDRTETRNS